MTDGPQMPNKVCNLLPNKKYTIMKKLAFHNFFMGLFHGQRPRSFLIVVLTPKEPLQYLMSFSENPILFMTININFIIFLYGPFLVIKGHKAFYNDNFDP